MSGAREYRLDDLGTTVLCSPLAVGSTNCPADLRVIWASSPDPERSTRPNTDPDVFLTTQTHEPRSGRGLCLHIRFEPGSPDAGEIMQFAEHRLVIPPRIGERFATCVRELERHPDDLQVHRLVHDLWAELETYLIELAARLSRLPGRSMEHRLGIFGRLEAARRLLEKELRSRQCVTRAAERASMSRSHFIRTFKSFYGQTPKQVRISRRLEMAKRLLRHSSLSVAEISSQTGFGNRCAFHRLFRERTGETPTEYREHGP